MATGGTTYIDGATGSSGEETTQQKVAKIVIKLDRLITDITLPKWETSIKKVNEGLTIAKNKVYFDNGMGLRTLVESDITEKAAVSKAFLREVEKEVNDGFEELFGCIKEDCFDAVVDPTALVAKDANASYFEKLTHQLSCFNPKEVKQSLYFQNVNVRSELNNVVAQYRQHIASLEHLAAMWIYDIDMARQQFPADVLHRCVRQAVDVYTKEQQAEVDHYAARQTLNIVRRKKEMRDHIDKVWNLARSLQSSDEILVTRMFDQGKTLNNNIFRQVLLDPEVVWEVNQADQLPGAMQSVKNIHNALVPILKQKPHIEAAIEQARSEIVADAKKDAYDVKSKGVTEFQEVIRKLSRVCSARRDKIQDETDEIIETLETEAALLARHRLELDSLVRHHQHNLL